MNKIVTIKVGTVIVGKIYYLYGSKVEKICSDRLYVKVGEHFGWWDNSVFLNKSLLNSNVESIDGIPVEEIDDVRIEGTVELKIGDIICFHERFKFDERFTIDSFIDDGWVDVCGDYRVLSESPEWYVNSKLYSLDKIKLPINGENKMENKKELTINDFKIDMKVKYNGVIGWEDGEPVDAVNEDKIKNALKLLDSLGENARRMLEIGIVQDELVKLGFQLKVKDLYDNGTWFTNEYRSIRGNERVAFYHDYCHIWCIRAFDKYKYLYTSPTWQQDLINKVKEIVNE